MKINHDWFLAIIIYTLNVDFRKIFDKYQNKLTEQIELHKNVFDLTLEIPLILNIFFVFDNFPSLFVNPKASYYSRWFLVKIDIDK